MSITLVLLVILFVDTAAYLETLRRLRRVEEDLEILEWRGTVEAGRLNDRIDALEEDA